MPAVAVNIKSRLEKAEFLAYAADIVVSERYFKFRKKGTNAFFNCSHFVSGGGKNFKAMSPGKLSFNSVNGISVFGIYILTVEPTEKSLFE